MYKPGKYNKILIPFLLCLILMACTAGKKFFQTAQQLDQAGKYQEAIAYYQEAIAKEPKNTKYIQALQQLKEKLVIQYTDQAKNALQADPLSIENIRKAKSKLVQAQEINAKHPAVKSTEQTIKNKETSFLQATQQVYNQARQAMDSGEWDKGYFLLQQLQSSFPGYEDSAQLLIKCTEEGSLAYLQQAEGFFEQEDFEQAGILLRKALALNAGNEQARELMQQVMANDNKDYFVNKGRQAISQQNWDMAFKAFKRALQYDPQDQELQQLLGHIQEQAGHAYQQKSQELMHEGKIFQAIEKYILAKEYLGQNSDFALQSIRSGLLERIIVAADRFKERKEYGSAWFWYQQAKSINSDYPGIFFKIQEMEDLIKQRVQKSIAVFDFGSPANTPDAGIIVANNLITFLFNNASGDIKILERENLRSILEEMKLGQIGVVSAQTAQEMGRVYGIDVAIMGSVLLYKVDTSTSTGLKTVRYKVGTKIEDNIEYLNWRAKHPSPSEEDLRNAPQAKIKVPQYLEKDYEVSKSKKVGFVALSFRIVDVSTGENIQVRTIERKTTVEDKSSAGLKEANIKYDPLEIPTDTELLQGLTSEVVSELGREALRPLRNLEQEYYKNGEEFLRRRQTSEAIESFVNAIFDEKMKRITSSPISSNAIKQIENIFYNQTLLN